MCGEERPQRRARGARSLSSGFCRKTRVLRQKTETR
jgi:hypothetical protein